MKTKNIKKVNDLMKLPPELDIVRVSFTKVRKAIDSDDYSWQCFLGYDGHADLCYIRSDEHDTPFDALKHVLERLAAKSP